jgi:hypothetical protein
MRGDNTRLRIRAAGTDLRFSLTFGNRGAENESYC